MRTLGKAKRRAPEAEGLPVTDRAGWKRAADEDAADDSAFRAENETRLMSPEDVARLEGAGGLERLVQARALLAEARTVDVAKDVRDKAQAIYVWARRRAEGSGAARDAAEIVSCAERRMGVLLGPATTKAEAGEKGGHEGGRGRPKPDDRHPRVADAYSDLGLSSQEVSRLRLVARIPDDEFEAKLAAARGEGRPVTKGEVLELAKATRDAVEAAKAEARAAKDLSSLVQQRRRVEAGDRRVASAVSDPLVVDDLRALVQAGRRFGTVYADPPWSYSNQGTSGTMANHYDGMPLADVRALPVRELAADDAQLHLWATSPLLPEAIEVMQAWGFTYKSSMVWIKTGRIGLGNYWRVNHELLLLGTRGKAPFPEDCHDVRSHLAVEPGRHSAKPDDFRKLVERVGPGPRIELFARSTSPGWVSWGDEVERTLFNEAAFGGAA